VTAWRRLAADVRIRWTIAIVFAVLALALPPLTGLVEIINPDATTKFTIFLGTEALVLALWAVSYNLMLGYAGMVSFAHAAYYGVGAYTVALLFQTYHVPVLAGLVVAPVVTAVVGFATGLVALRAVRLYFSLLTLAISQVLFTIAFNAYNFTGGDNGVHGLQIPDALADYTTMYYFVGAVVVVCLALMFMLTRSPFGAALVAIKENRERARSIGINVRAYELAVFTIAATFAGVAGGLFAIYQQEAFPEMMYWTQNATPVVVALLGGIGSFLGPAIGAFVFTELNSRLSTLPNQFDVILGAIVLLVVLVVPGGFSSLPTLFTTLRSRFRDEPDVLTLESTGDSIERADLARASRIEVVQVDPTPVARGEPLLVVEGLSRSFGGLRAVSDVNLVVHAGDRHAIIGPNGAGKSTLFNLITGRLKPSAGRISFAGHDITGQAPHRIARTGIGRAFQITMIFPRLTVLQNLQYAMLAQSGRTARPFGRADAMFHDEAMELLEAVGLGGEAALPAGQLSHGDQRAIELAISLALGSRLVLLDEPTAGMSAFETQKAMELVRRVAQEKSLTLLFCEHDMEVVFGTARTVTVMHMGRVLTEGTPDEVRANPDVQKVYLGQLEEEAVLT
jgi:ABC-type branched-subunit amino acid transport system ATPase component/ABC-type branched-subunit amino acid transport system permease subunit